MDDSAENDPTRRVLYVKSVCMTCLNKTSHCHYCNGEGRNYIEASDKTIAQIINNLSSQRKCDILKYIEKGYADG